MEGRSGRLLLGGVLGSVREGLARQHQRVCPAGGAANTWHLTQVANLTHSSLHFSLQLHNPQHTPRCRCRPIGVMSENLCHLWSGLVTVPTRNA